MHIGRFPARLLAICVSLTMCAACGKQEGRKNAKKPFPTTDSHYPEENAHDSAPEVPSAVVPGDSAFRSVPEAGKSLDAGKPGPSEVP